MPRFTNFSKVPRSICVPLLVAGWISIVPAQTTVPKKQKPAAVSIQKQAQARSVPRVLDRATQDNTRVLISLGAQRAYLLVDEEIAIDTPISSGKRAGMTRKGSFFIVQKSRDHRSNIYGNFVNRSGQIIRGGVSTRIDSAPSGTVFKGAPMKYFMRLGTTLNDHSAVGIHVGQLPGYPASHGCIRLPEEIASAIYERVKRGTSVVVQD